MKQMRKIVVIDEEKCNGCGQCVPSCAEGAIQIIDGKARLVAENLCDGIGNCLGTCPLDAIRIEERSADEFDEVAVQQHKQQTQPTPAAKTHPVGGGCPGRMLRFLQNQDKASTEKTAPADVASKQTATSQLRQWPVQLALLPAAGRIWQDADVLIAADCVATAMPDFHQRLLAGKTLAIACPKLDNVQPYVQKLAEVFAGNSIRSLTVAHMEVPCCTGIMAIVQTAIRAANREDLEIKQIVISVEGKIIQEATHKGSQVA